MSSIATSFDFLSPGGPGVSESTSIPLPRVSLKTYAPDGAVAGESSTQLEVIHLASPIDPHPPYESCSPLSHSIFNGDDDDNMGFIPYADDPTFDQIDHTHCYESFSWQDDFDPDWEVIVLEAAYRLHTRHGLTYNEIERSNVLPLKLRSQFDKSGLLSTDRRRDRLRWSGSTIPSSYVFPSRAQPASSDLRRRFVSANTLFCPNLSCVEPLCSVHGAQYVGFNSMPSPSKSLLPLSQILNQVIASCKNECFLDAEGEEGNPLWDAAEVDTFKVIFEISPDMTPCDLAKLCLKPCREVILSLGVFARLLKDDQVLYHRKLLYPDNPGEVQLVDVKGKRRTLNNDPCHHAGPCDSSANCPCFKNRSHCQRNCRCHTECDRRWRGCRCSKARSKWSCVTERCACVEASRECDPQLCLNCGCKITYDILDENTMCRNSQIQKGVRKELEVKKSSWGLGTFLAETAKAGDLIIEYNGELIYELTVQSRGELANHRNRCYVFSLNDTFSLDATYAGNISRFFDHSADEKWSKRVNCQAHVRLVHGNHRIGLFALRDLKAGEELLINYGSGFFTK
ncbi:SET domain-containing protein [Paxillus ammoniavirescens]|nr:SET domain-containing protein [Paxillus ammoniavirescens]